MKSQPYYVTLLLLDVMMCALSLIECRRTHSSGTSANVHFKNLPLVGFWKEVYCFADWSQFLAQENITLHDQQIQDGGHHHDSDLTSGHEDYNGHRSVCPWSYNRDELGNQYYPSFLHQAVCLCSRCLNDHSKSCQYLRAYVGVLKKGHCVDGRVTVRVVRINIKVGCYCQRNRVQSSEPIFPVDL